MTTTTKKTAAAPDGFINLPVTRTTRDGLHALKVLMDARSQAEVVARLVALGLAVHDSLSRPRSRL